MDRKVYKLPIGKLGKTKFPCPSCGKGLLRIKDDTFHRKETNASISAHSHEAWDPSWIEFVYSCLLECTNATCKDVVASSGVGSVTENYSYDQDGNPDVDHDEFFTPRFFAPHLKIFTLPKIIPSKIAVEIEKSFSLFFSDPASASNHVRMALEHLLTHLKIKRYIKNNGRRTFLALHKRIELLPPTFSHIQDLFLAIKWLGNAGSHSDNKISSDDVLDAYELMDELLVEIFSNKRKQLKILAKKINKKRGPK